MANPYLTTGDVDIHAGYSDPDDDVAGAGAYVNCSRHVAGLVLAAVAVLVVMHMYGFRATVGIGR